MRTLFVGAGAIGSLVGAYLAKGGAEVTLLDIADHIHTIAKEGLKVRTIGGESFEVKVKAVFDAKTIDNIDLLILTVKTFHTESALASVAHLKNRIQVALSIQNGVEKEDHLIRFFGEEKVAGGMCLEGATRLGPAEIQSGHGIPPDAVRRVRAANPREGGEGRAADGRYVHRALRRHPQAVLRPR